MMKKAAYLFSAIAFGLIPVRVPAATPGEAMQNFVTRIQANDPSVFWDAMPASFQEDITGLLAEFANKADPELWQEYFRLFRKTVDLAKDKKPVIMKQLENLPRRDIDLADADRGFDCLMELADIYLKSGFTNQQILQNPNLGPMIAETGGAVMRTLRAYNFKGHHGMTMEEGLATLSKISLEVLSEDGDTVSAKVGMEGEWSMDVTLLNVEGKWMEKRQKGRLERQLEHAKAMMEQWDPEEDHVVEMRGKIREGMKIYDEALGIIATINETDTKETIMMKMFPLMMKLGALRGQDGGGAL